MQQKRIYKLIIDGAKMLEFYRNNLRMVPHDLQPMCQEMFVKMADDNDTSDKDQRKKLKTTHEPDFTSIVNKTKQHGRFRFHRNFHDDFLLENLLKLFRKEKLLNDNDFYHWIRNYQCIDFDDDDNDNEDRRQGQSAVSSSRFRFEMIRFFLFLHRI